MDDYYGYETSKLFNFSEADSPVIYRFDFRDENSAEYTNWHEEIEILYFAEGNAQIVLDDTLLIVEPGDVVFIAPYCIHKIKNTINMCKYHCLIIGMDILQGSPFSISFTPPSFLTKEPLVCACIERIIQEVQLQQHFYKTIVQGEILSVLSHLSRITGISNGKTKKSTIQIRKAIQYIHEHYKEKITVDDICKAVDFSSAYFGRSFHQLTGKSMIDFLNHFRCESAYYLIQTNKYSISQCAEMSGFNNLSYFTRKFKQQFGLTPSEIKKFAENRKSI